MKINDEDLFHGAALIQIAESDSFTGINAFKVGNQRISNAFRVNDSVGLLVKYCSKPNKYDDYVFNFNGDQQNIIQQLVTSCGADCVFIALVCVEVGEICCLSYEEFSELIRRRREAKAADEDQYTVLITAEDGKSFRANISEPGKRGVRLGQAYLISRNQFPRRLFE